MYTKLLHRRTLSLSHDIFLSRNSIFMKRTKTKKWLRKINVFLFIYFFFVFFFRKWLFLSTFTTCLLLEKSLIKCYDSNQFAATTKLRTGRVANFIEPHDNWYEGDVSSVGGHSFRDNSRSYYKLKIMDYITYILLDVLLCNIAKNLF